MIERKASVKNSTGFHARPASQLCTLAMEYCSTVELITNDKVIDAKSVISIMAAGILGGTEILIKCSGDDEEQAVSSVCSFIEGFEE